MVQYPDTPTETATCTCQLIKIDFWRHLTNSTYVSQQHSTVVSPIHRQFSREQRGAAPSAEHSSWLTNWFWLPRQLRAFAFSPSTDPPSATLSPRNSSPSSCITCWRPRGIKLCVPLFSRAAAPSFPVRTKTCFPPGQNPGPWLTRRDSSSRSRYQRDLGARRGSRAGLPLSRGPLCGDASCEQAPDSCRRGHGGEWYSVPTANIAPLIHMWD